MGGGRRAHHGICQSLAGYLCRAWDGIRVGKPTAEGNLSQEQIRKVPPVRAGEATTSPPLQGCVLAGKDFKLGRGSPLGQGDLGTLAQRPDYLPGNPW